MHSSMDSETTRAFTRELPGGGYVAIEVSPSTTAEGAPAYHGEVVVERRAVIERREGHPKPVVAEAIGEDTQKVLDALFPIATSNAQVARRLLHRREIDCGC